MCMCHIVICGLSGSTVFFHIVWQTGLTSTCLWRWNRQSVLKRRHINSRRRVITQKKAYNKQDDFRKKDYWAYNFSFDFLYNFSLTISHSKKNWARYDQKRILVFTYSTHYSCQIVTELEFSRPIIQKYSNIKFHVGAMVVPFGQTDMTKLIVAFPNFAIASKIENSWQHKHFPRQISSWP